MAANGTGSGGMSTVVGHEPDEVLLQEVLHRQPGVDDRLGDDRHRHLVAHHLGGQPLRGALVDAEHDARGPLAEVADQGRHQPAAGGAHDTEAGVARLEALEEREVDPHGLELAPDAAGPVEHHPAELGRGGPPPAPDEDGHAEFPLQLADLLGDVRLHRVEHIGRRRERPRLGDGQQGVEVPDFHRSPSSSHSVWYRPWWWPFDGPSRRAISDIDYTHPR